MLDPVHVSLSEPFIRTCLVGVVSRLQGVLKITTLKTEHSTKQVVIPVHYSAVGSESYLKGLFLENEEYCKLDSAVEGTASRTLPYGIITMDDSLSVDMKELGSGGVRVNHAVIEEDEFGTSVVTNNSRVTFLPITLSFKLSVKCDTELTKFKVIDSILENLIYPKKFKIQHRGINNIGCTLKLTESISGISKQEFSYDTADGGISVVEVGLELLTYKPIISPASTYSVDNTNKNSIIQYTGKD